MKESFDIRLGNLFAHTFNVCDFAGQITVQKDPPKSQSLSASLIEVFKNENCWMGGLFKKRGEKWKTSVLPGLHSGVPASEAMKALKDQQADQQDS